ncbi:hypothetical protein OGM63_23115 [Plectonema radiosum NIES-515]|uniref:Transposase n=1 Tax=Plectonema radiosum NIES-515 TaxID=2986073 RepID=A0ABT3B4R1_9CYAN|nr:hypothetical protein [Plectonema radiosum]MCV3216366.1 hypothetical protein [Plectonema radiosum NIES-515]
MGDRLACIKCGWYHIRVAVGMLFGDRIEKTNYIVFKVRAKNSDIRSGKRAGIA